MTQSGFVVVESRCLWLNPIDTFVFPYQCDRVFYHLVHGDENWLYVIDVAPCSTPIFDNANTLTKNG